MTPSALPASRLLAGLMSLALLTACTSVRLDEPPPTSQPTASAAADTARYPPPRLREPPAQPIESTPVPPPPAARVEAVTPPSPVATTPILALPDPAPLAPAAPSASERPPSPAPAAVAPPAPARDPGASPAAAASPSAVANAATDKAVDADRLAPGRWSVQAGVFMVAPNAQALRARLAPRLAGTSLSAADRQLRIATRDGRQHVVIGDQPDRAGAIKLAVQLREALQQDVTLFAW